jgi:hypothetical protein
MASKTIALLRNNGLSLVTAGLFLVFTLGMAYAGFRTYTSELGEHAGPGLGFVHYLSSGHFLEAMFENWESEFLQMGLFVMLTSRLLQKGSAESKPLQEDDPSDEDPRSSGRPEHAPWPVRRGGMALALYERSLSIALLALFLFSFLLHALSGVKHENVERALHGLPAEGLGQYVLSSQFWFESFQNWQSEFLAVLAIVVLSIFLRQRGSPQSKPVAAPHAQTGH